MFAFLKLCLQAVAIGLFLIVATSATSRPDCASRTASDGPAWPAPMTIAS